MPRPIHFEIHADDPERAAKFYKTVMGWEITKWDGPADYWVIRTGPKEQPGIDGGLLRRRGTIDGTAVIAYVCTMDVPSVDEHLKKITSAGGQLAVPKMPIRGVGWLAYAKDTEGNLFGIMTPDANAK